VSRTPCVTAGGVVTLTPDLFVSLALFALAVLALWRSEAADARYYRRRERFWFEAYMKLARQFREAAGRDRLG
jgi:hypothetical protein